MLKRLVLALALTTALTAPSHAAPLVGALIPALAGTFTATLLGAGLQIAAGFALNWVAEALRPKPKEQTAEINPLEIRYGERVARSGAFGIVLLGGHRVHVNEFENAFKLQLVDVLADGWCDNLIGVYVNGKMHNLTEKPPTSGEARRFEVDGYGIFMELAFFDGRPDQPPSSELWTTSDIWTPDHRLAGQCYVVATLISNKELYNGVPELQYIIKGQKLYDPRKDPTVGGVGAHRFNVPATWEWTDNPALAAFHFTRGFYLNGQRVLGAGLGLADLDFDSFITAINVCDQPVTRPDGTQRKRYEANFVYDDVTTPDEVLQTLCQAMGGFFAEKQGQIAIFAGRAQTPVLTITSADIVTDEAVIYSPKRSGSQLYTGVQGTYTHGVDYQPVPYTALEPIEFTAADGKSAMMALDLPQVRDGHQAYLLAKQALFANRTQASGSLALDIKDLLVEVGDWVNWEDDSPLIASRTYRVIGSTHNLQTMRMMLQLEETSADVYSDTATAGDIEEVVRAPVEPGYQSQVYNLLVAPYPFFGAGGEELPGLIFQYSPILDPAVRGVRIEFREVGTESPLGKEYDASVGDGAIWSTSSVKAGVLYEARAQLDSLPGREYPWTGWVQANGVTGTVRPGAGTIDIGSINDVLAGFLGFLPGSIDDSLPGRIEQLHAEIARLATITTDGAVTAKKERREIKTIVADVSASFLEQVEVLVAADAAAVSQITNLNATVGQNSAGIINANLARVQGDQANATAIQNLNTAFNANSASVGTRLNALSTQLEATAELISQAVAQSEFGTAEGLFGVQAISGVSGVTARLRGVVRTSINAAVREAGFFVDVMNNGTTRFAVKADQFYFLSANGSYLTAPFYIQNGVVYIQNGVIQNLQTGNIAPQAVTNSDASIAIGGNNVQGSGWVTLVNIYVNSGGGQVTINASCHARSIGSGVSFGGLRLTRDGAQMAAVSINTDDRPSSFFGLNYVDRSGASGNWQLEAYAENSGMNFTQKSIGYINGKR